MANVLDYIYWRGDLDFNTSGFNAIDGVILARMSYMPFDMVLDSPDASLTAAEACSRISESDNYKSRLLWKDDADLIPSVIKSLRFGSMSVFNFTSTVDAETQKQFSAVTFRVREGLYCISFRGTDNTLVGWKEDLNMSFRCPVPSQLEAVDYFNKTAGAIDGDFILCGHSKGGNIAVYAAAFCENRHKKRIKAVYNYDGPGFDESVLKSESFKSITSKVHTFVPQSSVVGMLLGHEEKYTVIHSTSPKELLQHDIYSWEAQPFGFSELCDVTNGSKYIDHTLKEWLKSMSATQLETFVDAIYGLMCETNTTTMKQMGEKKFSSTVTILSSFRALDESTRKNVLKAFRLLMKSAKNEAISELQERAKRIPMLHQKNETEE